MNVFTCYLVGYISGKKIEECMKWRKDVRDHYDFWTNSETKKTEKYPIRWLDPLNGQQIGTIDEKGLKSSIPGKCFVHRDYNCVANSDLIIANMNTFGETRPLTGSIYELAWAWHLRKPTIIITDEENYKFHPFIVDTASIIVSTVEEMLERKLINYFYKGAHSALY